MRRGSFRSGVAECEVQLHENAEVLDARVGVPICTLQLPALPDALPTMTRWGTFVRLIMGIDQNDRGSITRVRPLEVPDAYATTFHFGALCSALSCSKGVDVFVLSTAGPVDPNELMRRSRDDPFGWNEDVRCHVWQWLAFASFSKTSTTSVTTFYCCGGRPGKAEIKWIRRIIGSTDLLKLILEASYPNQELGTVSRRDGSQGSCKIRPRAIFKTSDGIGVVETTHHHELVGEAIAVDPDGELVAFVPGFGLCRGQLCEVPKKRARISKSLPGENSKFKSLVVCPTFGMPIFD